MSQGIIEFPSLAIAQREGFEAWDRDLHTGVLIVRRLANGHFELAIVRQEK